MVECTMASLEWMREIKRTPKNEIKRHESLVEIGLTACASFDLQEVAARTRCGRVAQALSSRMSPLPKDRTDRGSIDA